MDGGKLKDISTASLVESSSLKVVVVTKSLGLVKKTSHAQPSKHCYTKRHNNIARVVCTTAWSLVPGFEMCRCDALAKDSTHWERDETSYIRSYA